MDESALKAIYINLYLLAAADGKIEPEERDFLKRFTSAARISAEKAHAWREEVGSGAIEFRPIEGEEVSGKALELMARMVRVDGQFEEEEQSAYINMGKALGFTEEQLGGALRKFWNKDPSELWKMANAPRTDEPDASATKTGPFILVEDDMTDMKRFEKSIENLTVTPITVDTLDRAGPNPIAVLFHAADKKADSKARLNLLLSKFPNTKVAFIARRDQAPQIGYLLELGATRCFVEPLYPGEIAKAVRKLT